MKPGPDPVPLPKEARLRTPVPAAALQQYTETVLVGMEMASHIMMPGAAVDEASATALLQLHWQNPNSNTKEALAAEGVASRLVEQHDRVLQDMLVQTLPIAKHTLPIR